MMGGWHYGNAYPMHGWGLLGLAVLMIVVYGIPAMRIVGRVGFPRGWGLLAAIPLVNIVALWVFAFTSWPTEGNR